MDDRGSESARAEEVAAIAARLRAGARALRTLSLVERAAAIDRAARGWCAPGSAWRREALARVPSATGYAPAAVAQALDNLWQAVRAAELRRVARTELPPEPARAIPDLALHVLAGNVPGAGVLGVLAALLVGTASLIKPARREPVLPALVAASLAAAEPRLRHALAVLPWRGGDAAIDRAAVAAADVVLAYGREETLEAIAAHRPRRLLRHGPRVSVALVAREARRDATVAACALQVALFDQQGCLSPQLVLLEERDRADTTGFVAALLAELERLATILPPAPRTLVEGTAIWRFLERHRWAEQEGEAVTVRAAPDGRCSVVCDRRTPTLAASPLHRHPIVVPLAALRDAAARLAPLHGRIEAVGFAGPSTRLAEAAAVAAALGATRLCPVERLQAPPFGWRQSGYARLASLLEPAPAAGLVPVSRPSAA